MRDVRLTTLMPGVRQGEARTFLIAYFSAPARWQEILIATGLIIGSLLLAYRSTLSSMVHVWMNSLTFEHGFAVAPLSAWLIWRKRHEVLAEDIEPNPWLLLPLSLVGLLWFTGYLALVNATSQFALVGLVVLSISAVLGSRAVARILFPLAFLFFAVPFGEFLIPVLMSSTADFTAAALRLSGVPVYRDGMQLIIPSGHWSIVEACSGIRYLIASVMVGALYAYLNYRSTRRRLLFMGVAVLVPIVANWIRAYLIVLIGHLSNNQMATGIDHIIYGWIFFGAVVAMMFFIGSHWVERSGTHADEPPSRFPRTSARWRVALMLSFVALIGLSPALAARMIENQERQIQPVLPPITLAASWRIDPEPPQGTRPEFDGAAAEFRQSYVNSNGQQVGLYIAYYRNQAKSAKLVSSSNNPLRGMDKHWVQVASSLRRIDNGGSGDFEAWSTSLRHSRDPRVAMAPRLEVWRLYWVDDRLMASDVESKIHGVLQRLKKRGDDAAAIVVYSDSSEAIQNFLIANLNIIHFYLRGVQADSLARVKTAGGA